MSLHPVREGQAINGCQEECKKGSDPHIDLHPVELHELASRAGDGHFLNEAKFRAESESQFKVKFYEFL